MRFCLISDSVCIGVRPFLLGPPLNARTSGAILGDFAYFLHMRQGLLPGVVRKYVREVQRVHQTEEVPKPGLTPGFKLMDKRLEQASRLAPNRRFALSAAALSTASWHDKPLLADAAIITFMLAGRPIECLAADTGPPGPLVMAWERIKWRRVDGTTCHPLDTSLAYALVHLYRKGDPYCGHWLPLFLTGATRTCGLRALQRRYIASGCPVRGPVIGRFPKSTFWVRRTHLGDFIRRVARKLNLPAYFFTAYSLRRGMLTAMAIAGVPRPARMAFAGHREPGAHQFYVDPDPRLYRGMAARVARTIVESAGRR